MDTRTPRTPAGGTQRGFLEDEPVLSTVKVPCDPAQVIVNHASFRVQLASAPPVSSALADAGLPRLPTATMGRRHRPVVWSGHSSPGDGATSLLQAVRGAGYGEGGEGTSTQLLPRVTAQTPVSPTLIAPRAARPDEVTQLIDFPRPGPPAPRAPADEDGPVGGDFAPEEGYPAREDDALAFDGYGSDGSDENADGYEDSGLGRDERLRGQDGRHVYYPGRRMSLGIVLLPLRILLGFIALYAGMGKLIDPVYFDGGERGSMVLWLDALEPWSVASPLHEWALAHPVGAGLTVAFTQIIVGVLTLFGLWQRVAAAVGALLSLALLATVSWQSGPAYDTPDIILLAAWSPLIIAGAPVYSLDARLAGEAWRTLGPRSSLSALRRRVLRRGALWATLLLGLALLIGSLLGGAVRSSGVVTVPGPGQSPRNHLPGEPLPQSTEGSSSADPTEGTHGETDEEETPPEADTAPPAEEAATSAPQEAPEESAGATQGPQDQAPQSEQTVQAPQQSASPEQWAPEESMPSTGDGGDGGGTSGGQGPAEDAQPAEEQPTEKERSGLVGGLLG